MTPSPFSPSILICEDDHISLNLMRDMISLRYPKATLYSAVDGRLGLQLFTEHLPDLVITDVQMPYLDGFALCEQVQSIKPATKVIFITAYGEATIEESRSVQTRFDFHLMKPLEYRQLFEAIEKCFAAMVR